MDTRSRIKARLIDIGSELDSELEEPPYITHHQDDLSGSEETEDDGELEESATDEGKVEPLVHPCRPHSHDSPPLPTLSRVTDTNPVRRPSFPSTDGTTTRSLPLTSSPSQVGKSRKSYKDKFRSLT